ncbi:MAG: hypothetical protein WC340_11235 [Kiritimatiellia bacterium]
MLNANIFVVYPSHKGLSGPIEECLLSVRQYDPDVEIGSWQDIDIPGRFIIDGVLTKIEESDVIIADITRLNFNVMFEIGYAIGKGKRVYPIVNLALSPQKKEIQQLGVYDTLGYDEYQNSNELVRMILNISSSQQLGFSKVNINENAPIYVLEPLYKTDETSYILSRLSKTGYLYRSFDPSEQPRLSLINAFKAVACSVAVIIPLLNNEATDYYMHNLRAALIAGLSMGMSKNVLILQNGNNPIPLDYRDFVVHYKNYHDIGEYINDLAPRIAESLHEARGSKTVEKAGLLANLNLGQPAAENEVSSLSNYYLPTDEFAAVLRGGIRLCVGRKGTGKSALFYQLRANLIRRKQVVVLDLKPQTYQLKQFRELILASLDGAVKEHIATAFWEYVLLLETCYRILDYDKQRHIIDHSLFEPYRKIATKYEADKFMGEADFSGRLLYLINRVRDDLLKVKRDNPAASISSEIVTEIVYTHDIYELRRDLAEYLSNDRTLFILFDNIDKGWPTRGIEEDDLIILHALLEATRKLERGLRKSQVDCSTTVFVRNDVYELLVDATTDRGKESKVSLDWSNSDLLKEFLRRRIVANLPADMSFIECCHLLCVSHVNGENAIDYMIDRSLMRPRNFLTIVNHAKTQAVNLGEDRIPEKSIKRGLEVYSSDLARELGLEIRDVFPQAEDILYCFIGAPTRLRITDIWSVFLKESRLHDDQFERAIEILLWFGFLGVEAKEKQILFIYDVYYDMKRLRKYAKDLNSDSVYLCVQKAFWPFLGIEER